MFQKRMKPYAFLIVISFSLHFVWEGAHVGLYGGYNELGGWLPINIWATLGDVIYTLGAALLVSLFRRDLTWFKSLSSSDALGLAIVGFFIALFVEYKAFALDRWFYQDAMPIIPVLEVGFTPVLQMTLLLPLSVFLASLVANRFDAGFKRS